MNKSITSLVIALCLLVPKIYAADAPKKPGPEHKKLEMAVGKWKVESMNMQSPFGPAGKGSGSVESRMILGGLFLENRAQNTGPSGRLDNVSIVYYDADRSLYQESWFDTTGYFDKPGINATCTIVDNTWNWSWTEERDGKKYHLRHVTTFAPDRKSFTAEGFYSEDGATWKKRYDEKGKRVGKATQK